MPLNAITGFSEVLSKRMFGEVSEKQAEHLVDILASVPVGRSLVACLLSRSSLHIWIERP
jgi:hypothetical protein